MPIDLLEKKLQYGNVRYEWDFPEFVPYERGKGWYGTAGVAVVLLLIFSWFTQNLLFAIFIFMVTFVVWYIQQRQPRMLNIKITDQGIVIENLFYTYGEIRYFWVVSEGEDEDMLYLEFRASTTPRLGVPFVDIPPERLQTYLEQFIELHPEREGRPISEVVSRWLRL